MEAYQSSNFYLVDKLLSKNENPEVERKFLVLAEQFLESYVFRGENMDQVYDDYLDYYINYLRINNNIDQQSILNFIQEIDDMDAQLDTKIGEYSESGNEDSKSSVEASFNTLSNQVDNDNLSTVELISIFRLIQELTDIHEPDHLLEYDGYQNLIRALQDHGFKVYRN